MKEQTIEILDAATKLVDAATPDVVKEVAPEPNYWWLMALALIPIWFGWWLNKRKKKNGTRT